MFIAHSDLWAATDWNCPNCATTMGGEPVDFDLSAKVGWIAFKVGE